jgi:hypothetical protein
VWFSEDGYGEYVPYGNEEDEGSQDENERLWVYENRRVIQQGVKAFWVPN